MAEKDWIKRYFAPLSSKGARELRDDVGLLAIEDEWQIITTDALVEGVHFLPNQSIVSVARKLVRVNVSDVLAKGALPIQAVLTLGWPSLRPESDIEAFAAALGEELSRWNIALIGGDTVASPNLFLSLTLTAGPSSSGRDPVWQQGAMPGDDLLLSGKIGGNIGLEDARAGRKTKAADHYYEPRLASLSASRLVAQFATAATDVSDGLLSDLAVMMANSNVGARVDLEAVRYWSDSSEINDLISQCTGGDDYQILCSASQTDSKKMVGSAEFYRIGSVEAPIGLRLYHNDVPVNLPETMGFEHGD